MCHAGFEWRAARQGDDRRGLSRRAAFADGAGVLLQCIMGGYPPARFYGSDDGDLALVAEPRRSIACPGATSRAPWPSAMPTN
jgi:hypothetical protein